MDHSVDIESGLGRKTDALTLSNLPSELIRMIICSSNDCTEDLRLVSNLCVVRFYWIFRWISYGNAFIRVVILMCITQNQEPQKIEFPRKEHFIIADLWSFLFLNACLFHNIFFGRSPPPGMDLSSSISPNPTEWWSVSTSTRSKTDIATKKRRRACKWRPSCPHSAHHAWPSASGTASSSNMRMLVYLLVWLLPFRNYSVFLYSASQGG